MKTERNELWDKWLTALRSGEYIQIRGNLRDGHYAQDRYCALGVLCEVSGLGHWDHDSFVCGDEVSDSGIPTLVYEALGLDHEPGSLQTQVWSWNDEEHMTFEKIADQLEKEWLK